MMSDAVLPTGPVTRGQLDAIEHARKVREGKDCGCELGYHDEETKMPNSTCCYIYTKLVGPTLIPCDMDAEWLIVSGAGPDDYTEACTEHVGDLLEGGKTSTVTEIARPVELNEPTSFRLKSPALGVIEVNMRRGDGNEERNQWKFSGTDNLLINLFDILCKIVVGFPFVVKPDKKPQICARCGVDIEIGRALCSSCTWVDEG